MKDGTTAVTEKTTPVPMFVEIEQGDDVAKGHVKVIQLNVYEVVGMKENEYGEMIPDKVGRGSFFCQDPEDVNVFQKLNPKLETEQFTVQLLKSTAMKYIDNPENMKRFGRPQ